MEKYRPDIDRVFASVDSIFAAPWPFSRQRWFGTMWPLMLTAVLVGVGFELTKTAILEVRRHIYNRNRNHKYSINTRNLTGNAVQNPAEARAHGPTNDKAGSFANGKRQNSTDTGKRQKTKYPKKNQKWRTTPHGRGRGGYRGSCLELLPLPPRFVENLHQQWDKVRDSVEEALKFGDMLIELEDYVDNSFIFGAGEIVGRKPGIKGFLREHFPHVTYKTAMRYRTLALKAREIKKDAQKHEKYAKIPSKCKNLREFGDKADDALKVDHRKSRHGKQHRKCHCHTMPGDTQPAIFALREQAHSAIGQMYGAQRERFINAMKELVREFTSS